MIEVKNLNKTYDRRTVTANHVLKDVSFTLPDKGFVCILGPSGCGKTSLLNAIGGLDVFDNGTLSVDELTVKRYGARAFEAERNRNFGYIFQNYYLLENHSVAYNIYLGLHSLKLSHAEKLKRVRQALQAVDMERYIRRTVGELSGGQQQRVAIARALARRPRVIFADEPTGNLDEDNTRNICTLLRQASKDSLVIMVTHEERIANFFADRIITLSEGEITEDTSGWEREEFTTRSDKVIYTGDLAGSEVTENTVSLRVFQELGAAPAELTVAVLKDRIVLKLSDSRAVTLSGPEEAPRLVEGKKPSLTLEEVEKEGSGEHLALFAGQSAPQARPGKGITLPMMFREARQLKKGKGLRRAGMRVFLILLTVLTLLTAGDFIALSRIDPKDFITTDSHLLQLTMVQGEELADDESLLSERKLAYMKELLESGQDFDFVPNVSARMSFTASSFMQIESETLYFPKAFSYAPIDRLDESTLIYGRMPESSQEIVVDRWVLEAMLETGDSVVQNTIIGLDYFLDMPLNVESRAYRPIIVGICDSGERSVYVGKTVLLIVRNSGSVGAMGLSELKRMYPDVYGDVTLEENECLVNVTMAGTVWSHHVGGLYTVKSSRTSYTIKEAIELDAGATQASIIVPDTQLEEILLAGMTGNSVYMYCPDKAAVKAFLAQKIAEDDRTDMNVSFSDPYLNQYSAYEYAANVRADARSIVTATVIVICLVMLYLLCRVQTQERIELLAVYRLLGIPKRKLHGIFLIEGVLSALTAIIPAAVLTWAAVAAIHRFTEMELAIVLPWQAAGWVSLGILGYYLLMSLLPLAMLLRNPPAKLAAKYDI